MSKKRVIAIFSGNRAEYGLQFPILQAVKNHPDLEYKLIVSGAHLDKNFGSTISEIKNVVAKTISNGRLRSVCQLDL